MRSKVVAFESANSFVKVFSLGRTKVYPNTLTQVARENYTFTDKNAGIDEDTVFTINGKKYHAGKTVDYHSSSSTSVDRYKSENYLVESLIALAQVTADGETVVAVTGLPANHYGDKDRATSYIKEALTGEHTILINGNEFNLHIKDVLVTLQPLASFFYCVMDEVGTADEVMISRFEDTETLIVDIGWGSNDVAVCRGSGLVDYRTLKTSMKNVYEDIAYKLKEQAKKDRRKLATHDIDLLDLEKQIRTKRAYHFANERYEVMDIYDETLAEKASLIKLEVDSYSGLDKFTTVIFTGGGSKSLSKDLINVLSDERGDLPDNIFIMDAKTAQVANVKGYYVFAKYLQ